MDTLTNGREVTRSKVVYTFNELSDEAKNKVVEAERDMAYQFLCLRDVPSNVLEDIHDHVLTELVGNTDIQWSRNFTDLTVEYSLSWQQGDGVAFYGHIYRNEAPKLNWAEGIEYVTLTRNHWGNHYTHSNCFDLQFFNEDGYMIGRDNGSRNDIVLYLTDNMKSTLFGTSDKDNMTSDQLTVWQSMTDIMNDLRQLCKTSERVGYQTIDDLTSKETIIDNLKGDLMPRKYDVNGKLVESVWWSKA